MPRPIRFLLLSLAIIAASSALGAQSRVRLGVSGGATIPVESFADENDAGWNFGAHLMLTSPFLPQDLKLEVQHNRLKHAATEANSLITSATLNLELNPGSATAKVAPYITTGLGGYFVQTVLAGSAAGETRYDDIIKLGWNGGAGLRFALPGVNAFVEARYHAVRSKGSPFIARVRYVPVVLGFTL